MKKKEPFQPRRIDEFATEVSPGQVAIEGLPGTFPLEEYLKTKEAAFWASVISDTELSKLSPEEIQRALALLKREKEYKAKIARGEIKGSLKVSEMTEAQKAAYYRQSRIAAIKQSLRLKKFMDAVAKGILKDVTAEEVKEVYEKKFGK